MCIEEFIGLCIFLVIETLVGIAFVAFAFWVHWILGIIGLFFGLIVCGYHWGEILGEWQSRPKRRTR